MSVRGPGNHGVICLAASFPDGWYDLDAFSGLQALLNRGDSFVDVGASLGSYSVVAAEKLQGEGVIVAFEPQLSHLPYLASNINSTGVRCVVVGAACGQSVGWVDLGGAEPTMMSVTSPVRDSGRIAITTLDAALAAIGGLPGQVTLKIDVEGHEPDVLVGASKTLNALRPNILLEANGLQYRSSSSWTDAVAVLHGLDYAFVWTDIRSGVLWQFAQPMAVSPFGDYLAIPGDRVTALQRRLNLQQSWRK